MANVQNSFIKSKLNKDLDARLLPNGEYRDAKNVQVSRSEGANVGSLENVLGNEELKSFESLTGADDMVCIGKLVSDSTSEVYLFLTSNTDPNPGQLQYTPGSENYIIVYNSSLPVNNSIKILVKGSFLNFSTTHEIYHANLLEDLLFWTDNRNQPRKINVSLANPTGSASPTHYVNEDQISVAKYNPYQPIQLWQKNLTSADPVPYETTMKDVNSKTFPNGATAFTGGTSGGGGGASITLVSLVGEVPLGNPPTSQQTPYGAATVGYIAQPGAAITPIPDSSGNPVVVDTIVYGAGSADEWTVVLKKNLSGTPQLVNWPTLTAGTEIVFNYNTYYDKDFAGDENYLEDKFVRFSYRFKYEDNEYSLTAPFTQHAFVPKQYGYFLEGDDEKTKASSIVEFMENQITTAGLVINLPYKSNEISDKLKVDEIQLLYKASDDLNVKVIADVKVSDFTGLPSTMTLKSAGSGFAPAPGTITNKATTGGSGSGLTLDLVVNAAGETTSATVNISGEGYKVGDIIEVPVQGGGTAAEYTVDSLSSTFIYNYSSEKPIKVLTDEEVTRVSDIVPMRAQTQEVVGNRVVYGNFLQNNATPLTLDYKLETVTKGSLTSSTTNKEFLNNTLKQNRSYQVGIVLQDRYGRASNVIINQLDLITKNSTIFNSYTNGGINPLGWPGESLKVIFNSQIPSELPSSLPYNGLWKEGENPLGWYTYKIVVQQQEQDYYNIYVPGALSGNIVYTKNNVKLTYSNTSSVASIALFNDNINKIPRDLKEVGPTDNIYGSSVVLYNRVKQNKIQTVGTSTNITIGQQNLSPLKQEVTTVRPFNELGQWTSYKNINLHYIDATSNTHSQYPDPTFIYPGAEGEVDPFFLRNNKNPLIATINTQKRMGFTFTNQEDSTYLFADKLMVFETEPFKSNIDIYYETSTTGVISELNNSILSDGSGTTDAPFGLSSVNINNWFESTAVGQSISNTFEVINSSGASQGGTTALSTTVVIKEITNSGTGSATNRPTVVSPSDWPIGIEQVTAPVSPNTGPTFRFIAARRYPFLNGSDTSRRYDVTLEISTDTYPSINVNIRAVQLSNVTPILYRISGNNYSNVFGDKEKMWIKSQDKSVFENSDKDNPIPTVVTGNTGIGYDQEVNAVFISKSQANSVFDSRKFCRYSFVSNGYDPINVFNQTTDSNKINKDTIRLQGLTYKIIKAELFGGGFKSIANPDSQTGRVEAGEYYRRYQIFNGITNDPSTSNTSVIDEFTNETIPTTNGSIPVLRESILYQPRGGRVSNMPSNPGDGFKGCYVYVLDLQITDASEGTGFLPSATYTINFIITK